MRASLRFGFQPRKVADLGEDDLGWLRTLTAQTAGTLVINDLYCIDDVRRAMAAGTLVDAINMGLAALDELTARI